MDFEILDWDSAFFGFRTARILPTQLDQSLLAKILEDLRAKRVRLAYWAPNSEAPFDTQRLGGYLADKKVTFRIDLHELEPEHFISTRKIRTYQPDLADEPFLDLAMQAGLYSRFARDPQFPRDKFVALYQEWMRKCLNKELADDVLFIQEDNIPVGMVTVASKNGTGDIGLIAVDKNQRGKHYGEMLVRAAQLWYLDHSLDRAEVVTQGENEAACRLYRKCGYEISRTQFVYHFWL